MFGHMRKCAKMFSKSFPNNFFDSLPCAIEMFNSDPILSQIDFKLRYIRDTNGKVIGIKDNFGKNFVRSEKQWFRFCSGIFSVLHITFINRPSQIDWKPVRNI